MGVRNYGTFDVQTQLPVITGTTTTPSPGMPDTAPPTPPGPTTLSLLPDNMTQRMSALSRCPIFAYRPARIVLAPRPGSTQMTDSLYRSRWSHPEPYGMRDSKRVQKVEVQAVEAAAPPPIVYAYRRRHSMLEFSYAVRMCRREEFRPRFASTQMVGWPWRSRYSRPEPKYEEEDEEEEEEEEEDEEDEIEVDPAIIEHLELYDLRAAMARGSEWEYYDVGALDDGEISPRTTNFPLAKRPQEFRGRVEWVDTDASPTTTTFAEGDGLELSVDFGGLEKMGVDDEQEETPTQEQFTTTPTTAPLPCAGLGISGVDDWIHDTLFPAEVRRALSVSPLGQFIGRCRAVSEVLTEREQWKWDEQEEEDGYESGDELTGSDDGWESEGLWEMDD